MRLEEIQKRYNISSSDPAEIKSQLKMKIKENHPDNNNNFNSEYFSELNNDLDYVENLIRDSENQNILVPMNEVLQTFAEIFQVSVKKDEDSKEILNEKLSDNIQSRLLITKKHLRTPRICSATIAAIITFLWIFPNQVVEHPLVQMLFGDTIFAKRVFALGLTVVWFLVLLVAVMFWTRSVSRERREKEIMERFKLESVQNKFFMDFMNNKFIVHFSKLEFMGYLAHELSKGQSQNFEPEEEMVQNMADIILLRAVEYGVIKTIKSHGLIDCYEIVRDE